MQGFKTLFEMLTSVRAVKIKFDVKTVRKLVTRSQN